MTLITFTFEGRSVSYRTEHRYHACQWAREDLGITVQGCWAQFGDHYVWNFSGR